MSLYQKRDEKNCEMLKTLTGSLHKEMRKSLYNEYTVTYSKFYPFLLENRGSTICKSCLILAYRIL